MIYKAKGIESEKLEVEFPDGTKKKFNVVGRSIGAQRKIAEFYSRVNKTDSKDPKKAFAILEDAIVVLFPGHTLEEFESLETEDLTNIINTVRDNVLSPVQESEPEKKTEL
jgi:hypothetical protein